MPLPIPCYRNGADCPDRTTTCHCTCIEYKKYVAKNEKIKEAKRVASDANSYLIKSNTGKYVK